MPFAEYDDAETSFRCGFEQGAVETFRSVEQYLDPATREVVRVWIEHDVRAWRLTAILDHPPIWRLGILSSLVSN